MIIIYLSIILCNLFYLSWLCDYSIILSSNILIIFFISSIDIIHSFGLSSIGIRIDCIPGRINIIFELIKLNGKIRGLCYELCGQYHSTMVVLGLII